MSVRKAVRPRRGDPEGTRERLVAAAAKLFNGAGYHGTDSNKIAEAAGYSPGTFYKHFEDKREIFLAAYEAWVSSEWRVVERELSTGEAAPVVARRLVESAVRFHTRWRGLRASLHELAFTDPKVRTFYRKQRRGQLDVMARLREQFGGAARGREEDALHLFMMERCCDAIAQGELRELGVEREALILALAERVEASLR